jgi:hypothetical protein
VKVVVIIVVVVVVGGGGGGGKGVVLYMLEREGEKGEKSNILEGHCHQFS